MLGPISYGFVGTKKENHKDFSTVLSNNNSLTLNVGNCQNLLDHGKSKRVPKSIYFCFIDYAKAFDCVNHNKLWKILKEMGIPDHLTCLLRNYMQVRKQPLELDMEQQTGSK